MNEGRLMCHRRQSVYILIHMLVSFRLMLLIGAGEADGCILYDAVDDD